MKVIRKDKSTKISNLHAGDVFKALDSYYMVLDRYDSATARQSCVNIETGSCSYFDYEAIVVPYEAKVVI